MPSLPACDCSENLKTSTVRYQYSTVRLSKTCCIVCLQHSDGRVTDKPRSQLMHPELHRAALFFKYLPACEEKSCNYWVVFVYCSLKIGSLVWPKNFPLTIMFSCHDASFDFICNIWLHPRGLMDAVSNTNEILLTSIVMWWRQKHQRRISLQHCMQYSDPLLQ